MFKKSDFMVKKRAGGWAVVRCDDAILALGFSTKAEATEWMDKELALAFEAAA